jgi:hypothetical protein
VEVVEDEDEGEGEEEGSVVEALIKIRVHLKVYSKWDK